MRLGAMTRASDLPQQLPQHPTLRLPLRALIRPRRELIAPITTLARRPVALRAGRILLALATVLALTALLIIGVARAPIARVLFGLQFARVVLIRGGVQGASRAAVTTGRGTVRVVGA